LNALVESLRPLEPPWSEVGRTCRRICLLRAAGRYAEAQRIEDTELAAAAAKASREGSGPGPEADARLATMLAGEAERVAAAVAFAEILAPMLSERLGDRAAIHAQAPKHPHRGPGTGAPGGVRGIADFIEEMLAQDRAGTR